MWLIWTAAALAYSPENPDTQAFLSFAAEFKAEKPLPARADGYASTGELWGQVASLVKEYPELIRPEHLGSSVENRPLWALHLGAPGQSERRVMVVAQLHALEWVGAQAALELINDFVAVGFPGWSGAVTGFSTKVALSEKVWETYNGTGIQEGQYDGEPDALVIRDIMQFANNIDDAVAFTEGITRTWAIFIGVGEVDGGQFRALGYRKKNLQVFGPDNISSVTHAPAFDDVVYIDKHPQPSHDNVTMPALMAK